jgi:hypothetical protein
MTLRIEVHRGGSNATTIRLIGRIQAEHMEELERLMGNSGSNVSLDLGEVSLVDVEVVQFLAGCATRGVQLERCPPYVAEWIGQQQEGSR